MAILEDIRKRPVFLIAIIGLALFAFVADPSALGDFFSANKVNEVGQINGETIDREAFANRVEQYKTSRGSNMSQTQATNAVWNSLVSEKVYQDQLEKAGIVVGEEDVWNAIVNSPSMQNDPAYKNEAGIFDEEKLKEAIAVLKDNGSVSTADVNAKARWNGWLNYERQVKLGLERQAYLDLVKSGMNATLKDAERKYIMDNTKMSGQYVYVPYTSIVDSLVTVSKAEVKNYVAAHPSQFKVDASRDLKYVVFDTKATEADEKVIKDDIAALTADFKSSTNDAIFVEDAKSDLSNDNTYKYRTQIPTTVANMVFGASKGDVVGPYKDAGYFKLSKVAEVAVLPDSVKSSHIIVPFVGSQAANAQTVKNEEQAKKTADSIYALVKNNFTKFKAIADDINIDGTKGKGGDIGWVSGVTAFGRGFDDDFANFIFTSKKGDVGVVKTAFGYHVIKVEDQKNKQNVVKLNTVAKQIVPSETTEASVYEKAEVLASNLTKNNNIDAVAKEAGYTVKQSNKLRALSETFAGFPNQRQIVNWAFDSTRKIGDSQRFDLDNGGFIVVSLSGIQEKGLASVETATAQVRPILVKQKKAAMIEAKMNGATINEIATACGEPAKSFASVSLDGSMLTGVGKEPAVVGAMYAAKENTVVNKIVGEKGVFAIVVNGKSPVTALPNYEPNRNAMATTVKNKANNLYNALKEATPIEDNRAKMY